jgi:hypothetical protein
MSRALVLTSIGALLAATTIVVNAEKFGEPLAVPLAVPFAEPGDPARWYIPADTPARKYQTHMKEAAAALKEALGECRAAVDRRACEREAREVFRSDVAKARAVLSRP